MSPKRKIKASEIIPDLRRRMSNLQLMEKYNLSPDGLRSVFTKLVQAKVVSVAELEGRMFLSEDSVVVAQVRGTPRAYPGVPLPIYDMDNMEEAYFLLDISETGLQVIGIHAEAGQKVTFLVQALAFDGVEPFSFEAECRWTTISPGGAQSEQVAGFEIIHISDEHSAELRKLFRAIKDESPQPSELV